MSATELELRREIVECARRLNTLGLNQGTSGNLSARIAGGFLITPSGLDYEKMAADQIVAMNLNGDHHGGLRPSSEWRMHRDIYRQRADAGAVIHIHSPFATALATLRADIPAFHYMIAVTGGASLRCADYATFGTEDLSRAMLSALRGRKACLLANHGMICFGQTLENAVWLAGEIEALCRQYAIARTIGEPVILDEDEIERVLERFRTHGQRQADQDPSL